MKSIAIYLAGSIKKEHEITDDSYWTEDHMILLKNALQEYSVSFLNPAFRSDDLSDHLSVFGRDMTQIFCSDIVFVDARERRGLGVGAEMMWAKLHNIPVVTWAPKNSHYKKEQTTILGVPVDEYIHPFVLSLSDAIVESVEHGADWILSFKSNPNQKIKGIQDITDAMEYYKTTQLHLDQPMLKILESNEKLKQLVIK